MSADADRTTLTEEDAPAADRLPDDRFIDREISWLAFNERVLALAEDERLPLLERTRFLAIFATNLDEFFMVRVASLKRRIATGVAVTAPSGLQPREQLAAIYGKAHELMSRHSHVFREKVLPALAAEGITLVRWTDLPQADQEHLSEVFQQRIYPVLTPLAVDPAHPFPYISGLSLNLAVVVRNPDTGAEHFARVKVPPLLGRFVEARGHAFVPMEDVILHHLPYLFPGMEVLQAHTFRVTRNEDLEVDEDDAENLLQAMEKELLRRRFGPPVRLEVEPDIDAHVLELIVRELGVHREEVYRLEGPLDLSGLHRVADVDRPDLRYRPFRARTHFRLHDVETGKTGNIFTSMRAGDILVHHPFDSFTTSVQALVQQAARDPDVLAIKQTLYRTSGDSPIVDALIDAADAGKQVLVLIEIKARFDEQANIRWAKTLEEAGCHVVYGLVGLKTHCKLLLIVRQEGEGLRRYVHVGTGNYNPKTARLYEDIGLFTTAIDVASDLTDLFNHLSGYSRRTRYDTLLVAPTTLRSGVIEGIDRCIAAHRRGERAAIQLKLNSLVDEAVIDALYQASRAGLPIDLIIRGICALRPGVPGLSETIRVRSILGRFLEHSRVFRFVAGADPQADEEYWIGSADMMHRNLDRRVEALVRVKDPAARAQLAGMLDFCLSDRITSWHLDAAGEWNRSAGDGTDYQEESIRRMSHRSADV